MADFKELRVWHLAMDLLVEIYRVTDFFPPVERFGLTFQLKKVAVSVPSNIAEGHARSTPRDFVRFMRIAAGSLAEGETQLLGAIRLGLVTSAQTERALTLRRRCGRSLAALIKHTQGPTPPPPG